jgi:hypothetical protein
VQWYYYYTHFMTATLSLRRHDVQLGRGRGMDRWCGNVAFRRLVRAHQPWYQQADIQRSDKRDIAEHVVNAVIENGGRFLQKSTTTTTLVGGCGGGYEAVSWSKAVEKASQALREKVKVGRTPKQKQQQQQQQQQQQRRKVVAEKVVAPLGARRSVRFTSTTTPTASQEAAAAPSPPPPPLRQNDDGPHQSPSFVALRTVSPSSTSSSNSNSSSSNATSSNSSNTTSSNSSNSSSSNATSTSHNGANSTPDDDNDYDHSLARVVTAAASVELDTMVVMPSSDVNVVNNTPPPPLPISMGLAAWSPPCTATAAAPPSWCCSLQDKTTNPFDSDCLVAPTGYAARPSNGSRNTTTATAAASPDDDEDDDDPISVTASTNEDNNNSVGMFDFDPMQAWYSLLHNYGPSSSSSSSPTSTMFFE